MKSATSNSIATATALVLIVLFPNESALGQGCSVPDFAAARTFDAGTNPVSVATGDFNLDGRRDLAVANNQGVAVLLNDGDGTFPRSDTYTAGSGPRVVGVGDFNGDGSADLAVVNYGEYVNYRFTNSSVSVLVGRGDGTFRAAVNYGAGETPVSLAVGDLNGDGKADLVVANDNFDSPGTVSVLLGKGDGTFQSARSNRLGSRLKSVAVGEFNGDGKLDLAVADRFGVWVPLGKGDGTFQTPIQQAIVMPPSVVLVADFNGDGKSDLAVGSPSSTNVFVLLGNGDATFQRAANYAAQGNSVLADDFNDDGTLDLATPSSVLFGNGDGSFRPGVADSPVGSSVAAGDFNGDGHLDIASAHTGGVSVFLNLGGGNFQTAAIYDSGRYAASMALGDFDGDGRPDLALAQRANQNLTDGGVVALMGKDNATFEPPKTYGAGIDPVSVAVGDFNGDSRLDLAAANVGSYPYTNGGVSVLLGNGNGTFQTATNFKAGRFPASVAAGDFNGDGKQDLAVANLGVDSFVIYSGIINTNLGNVSILVGNGDGTFQSAVNYTAGRYPTYVAVGDLNADGKPDLVVVSANRMRQSSNVFVLLGKGDGTFELATVDPASVGNNARSVAVCDFNDDGKLDLAVANYGYSGIQSDFPGGWEVPPDPGSISVLLGTGNGTFQSVATYIAATHTGSVAADDFNGDGKPDLAVTHWISGNIAILPGRGDGTFQQAVNYVAGWWSGYVLAGDFDGDGRPDLAAADSDSGHVSILLNTCSYAGIRLMGVRTGAALTLFWPLPYTNFVLESATNLGSTNWQHVSQLVNTNNGRCEVTVPLSEAQRYFRLRKT